MNGKKQKVRKKLSGRRKGRIAGPGIIIAVIVCCIALFACCNGKYVISRWNQMLGEKYLQEEKYEQAITALEKAIEAGETNVEAYKLLADAYVRKEEFDAALSILEKGIKNTDNQSLYEKRFQIQKVIYERLNYVEFPFELQDFNVLGYDLRHDYFQDICEKLECPVQGKEKGLLKTTSDIYGNMAAWVEDSEKGEAKHLMVENGWLFHYFVRNGGQPYIVLQYSDISILGEAGSLEYSSSKLLSLPVHLGDTYEKCIEIFCKERFLNSSEQSILKKEAGNSSDATLYSMYCSWGNVTYMEDLDSENNKEIEINFYLNNGGLGIAIKFDENNCVDYISVG